MWEAEIAARTYIRCNILAIQQLRSHGKIVEELADEGEELCVFRMPKRSEHGVM